MGVPTYETLHLLHNELNSNAMAFQSNLGVRQHGYLGLVVSPTFYAHFTNAPFVCQVNPVNLIVLIAATRHAQEELKYQYD